MSFYMMRFDLRVYSCDAPLSTACQVALFPWKMKVPRAAAESGIKRGGADQRSRLPLGARPEQRKSINHVRWFTSPATCEGTSARSLYFYASPGEVAGRSRAPVIKRPLSAIRRTKETKTGAPSTFTPGERHLFGSVTAVSPSMTQVDFCACFGETASVTAQQNKGR